MRTKKETINRTLNILYIGNMERPLKYQNSQRYLVYNLHHFMQFYKIEHILSDVMAM